MENLVHGLLGGIAIGFATALMLIVNGRITGVSGIFKKLPKSFDNENAWRVYFVLGLVGGGFLQTLQGANTNLPFIPLRPLPVVAVGGLLVGFGTIMGSGCTSGHGFCGLARFSKRSLVAVVCFTISGILTATLLHLFLTVKAS